MKILEALLTIQNGFITLGSSAFVVIIGIVSKNLNRHKKEVEKKLAGKADKELTEQRFDALNEKINSKADAEKVAGMEKNIIYIRDRIDILIDKHVKL